MKHFHLTLRSAPPAKGPHLKELLHACSTAQRTDWRQSGVLQGPTVQLRIGLNAPRSRSTFVPTALQHSTGFMRSGSAARRWPTQERVTLAVIFENGQIAMEFEADARGRRQHQWALIPRCDDSRPIGYSATQAL